MRLPQPGEAVGPYTCLRLLASGGMGAVYEARRPDLPRSVALKLLLAPDDPDLVARFHREAEACGRLDHPNLVRVHESGVAGQACYLVMELVQGGSLQAHLERAGPLDSELARQRIGEAAAGIAQAHASGVLHRDLKPSNLLWDEELNRVRVVDFGLTGRLSAADSLTVTGEILGTPGYLAPEQVGAAGGVTGPATDVYGLGATLFALLSGRPPFVGNGMAGLAEVATDSAPDLRSLQSEIDPDLAAIVARCLQKDPALRYESVQELIDVLERRAEVGRVISARRRRLRGGLLLGVGGSLALAGVAWAERSALQARVHDYRTWRREALEGFAYGWGPAGPELEGELRAWARGLSAGSSGDPEWGQSMREVRAHLRLLAARKGEDPGFPGPESIPSPGAADHLAEAVLEVQRGQVAEAEAALARVGGRLASGPVSQLTREALAAYLEPRAFLGRLRPGGDAVRGVNEHGFPVALGQVAPEATQAELVRWSHSAARAGCAKPGVALQEALRESLPLREAELAALEGRELAPYLRQLCSPIRAAGLWPDPGFVDLCRERLSVEVDRHGEERGQAERALAVVRFEHEVFYRVQPEPCWLGSFRTLLALASSGSRNPKEYPILIRSLHRYGLQSGGFQLGSREGPGPQCFAAHPEPQGRLESAYQWYLDHSSQEKFGQVGACSAAQADLERLLATGVDDLHPGLVCKLFEVLIVHWQLRPKEDPAPRAEEAARLTRLAGPEFERALKWLLHHPSEFVQDQVAISADLAALPWLLQGDPASNQHQPALASYERSLNRLREIIARASPAQQAPLGEALAKTLGGLGRTFRDRGVPKALELLVSGEEKMKGWDRGRAEFLYFWGALLDAYRRAGQNSRAVALIDELGLTRTTGIHLLAVPIGESLLEAKRGPLAIPPLQRARERVLGREEAGKVLPRERVEIVRVLDRLLAACEAQAR